MKALCLFLLLINHPFFSFENQASIYTVPEFKLLAKTDHKTTVISIYKNKRFSGQKLEVLYKIECYDTKEHFHREFVIKKTDSRLKEKTLSDFILIENKINGKELVYPFGWANEDITIKEMRDDCILILEAIVIAI